MKIYYSSKFAREYKRLSLSIKKVAENREKIFREDPFDTRLNTHKLKGKLKFFWSFSVNNQYRIIFEFADRDIIWFHSVGDHSIYANWD